MFANDRQRMLDLIAWGIGTSDTEFIETWKYSPNSSPPYRVRFGKLTDANVDDWLRQRGEYVPPSPPTDAKVIGGLRLVLSERGFYRPLSFSLSKESYLRIEEEFHLPEATLPGLADEGGSCSRYDDYDEDGDAKPSRIAFVIRAFQKYQVANYGLAVSFDFRTGFSTGILHGTGVVNSELDFFLWNKTPSAELFDAIEASAVMSAEPLYLPVILLQHHLYRTKVFCTVHMENDYNRIQAQLGTTRAGRLHTMGDYQDPVGNKTINEARVGLRNLTGELSTFMTESIWFCRISEWHVEYINFLSNAFEHVSQKVGRPQEDEQRKIRDAIEYLRTSVQGLKRCTGGAKERAAVDFTVLYNLTAQLDNRLNAKISASASRDSMAMKVLAFITTFFLPGTFVATFFSMDMFNWQDSASGESPSAAVVSPYLWIYWAVTVPLTIIVAFSWRMWWTWEKGNFDRDVRMEIENIEAPSTWDLRKGGGRREAQQ